MREIIENISNASCSEIGQVIFGAWAVGFLIAPNMPMRILLKPFCSLSSVSVDSELIARIGALTEKVLFIRLWIQQL